MNLENAFALLIGVGGKDIEESVEDAKALAAILKDPKKAAYNPDNVTLLIEQDATRNNIVDHLERLISTTKDLEDSTVVIFYSGHGGQFKSSNVNPDYYLITHGYLANDKETTGLSGALFSNLVNTIPSKKLFVMLDCCHASGIMGEQQVFKMKSLDDNIVNSNIALIDKLKGGEGRVFLSSCDDDEQSFIQNNHKNSIFTSVILEGLEGYTDEEEGYVSIMFLLYYVLEEVPKRVKKLGYIQRPMVNSAVSLSPDYYICKASLKPQKTNTSQSFNTQKAISLIQTYNMDNSHTNINTDNIFNENIEINAEALKQQIEDFIFTGNIEKAALNFLILTKAFYPDLKGYALAQAARYNSLLNDKMEGIISDENYRIELARTKSSILHFLKKCH